MSNRTKKAFLKNRREKGIALVWSAIMMIVLILFLGLVIDISRVFLVSNQLQNAADAAALAGAQFVRDSEPNTRDRAYDLAFANHYSGGNTVVLDKNSSNNTDGDIVIGIYSPSTKTFTPTTFDDPNVNAVKVVARCTDESSLHNPPVSLLFGPIVGVQTVNVTRSAIAMVTLVGNGLITLCGDCSNPQCDKVGLNFSGSAGELIVNNGNIQINSYAAASGNAHPPVEADAINIVECPVAGFLPPDITQCDKPCVPDPLGSLPPPPWDPANDLSPKDSHGNPIPLSTQSQYKGPGYYSAGIDGAGVGSLILSPGIHALGGVGGTSDKPNGLKGSFTANNVMFYITGTGGINLQGSEQIIITPMTSDVYKGIAIFQDRNDSHTPKNGLNGGEGLNIQGTIYLPAVDLLLTGNPGTLGNQIILNTLEIKGNVSINVNYTGAFGVFRSFLVQ